MCVMTSITNKDYSMGNCCKKNSPKCDKDKNCTKTDSCCKESKVPKKPES